MVPGTATIQTESRSIQPFLPCHDCDRLVHRTNTDHATRFLTIGRIYVRRVLRYSVIIIGWIIVIITCSRTSHVFTLYYWLCGPDRKCRMFSITTGVLAGWYQTRTDLHMVQYGWMMLAASVQRLSLVTATILTGVAIIVLITKTLLLLATMQPKMVHSCNLLLLRVFCFNKSIST